MKKTDAAVFVILGQSNAVGHKLPMTEEDKIANPLKNVFGLHRRENQSYDLKELTWSGYTSAGMNLAEEQDDTYSVPNCLARMWQDAVDAGEDLPDLYIVQIAIGAQGVTGPYMWNPNHEKVLVPGKLGTVHIALCPFTNHILSLLPDSFRKMGKTYEVMGIHWRGGENDMGADEERRASMKGIYEQLFGGFCHALGERVPIILHRLVCMQRGFYLNPESMSLQGMVFINHLFEELCRENDNFSIFSVFGAPFHQSGLLDQGIFKPDFVHFTEELNRWVAAEILRDFRKKH